MICHASPSRRARPSRSSFTRCASTPCLRHRQHRLRERAVDARRDVVRGARRPRASRRRSAARAPAGARRSAQQRLGIVDHRRRAPAAAAPARSAEDALERREVVGQVAAQIERNPHGGAALRQVAAEERPASLRARSTGDRAHARACARRRATASPAAISSPGTIGIPAHRPLRVASRPRHLAEPTPGKRVAPAPARPTRDRRARASPAPAPAARRRAPRRPRRDAAARRCPRR